MDEVSDTPKEIEVEADKPNIDDQWEVIVHDNTQVILPLLREAIRGSNP